MNNAELYHHGVLGMKWGVRRYQNKDGSLTAAGRNRLANDVRDSIDRKRDSRRREKERASSTNKAGDTELAKKMRVEEIQSNNIKKKYSEMTSGPDRLKGTKKLVDASNETVRQIKNVNDNSLKNKPKAKMDLSSMSDKEMRDQINRALLERQYNDMFAPQTTSKGREYATKTLDVAGSALAITGSALSIAIAIKELKKSS